MSKSNIDWPIEIYTWNPFIGCQGGCEYCWAKMFWKRFTDHPFEKIRSTKQIPKPKFKEVTFFATEFTDPYFWNKNQFEYVMTIIKSRSHQKFITLTKKPSFYLTDYEFPKNLIIGITDTGEKENKHFEDLIERFKDSHQLLFSFEPLMGPINYKIPENSIVIVGAMNYMGAKNVKVKKEWVDSIKNNYSGNIYFKKNMHEYK